MVGLIASHAGGCQYCVAHNAFGIDREGIAADKQQALWDFRTSPLFSAAERAALELAAGAGQSPNATTDADFGELRRHFDDRQIIELIAVIALFGFLNRWNATLATTLEGEPLEFARKHMAAAGWSPGAHAQED